MQIGKVIMHMDNVLGFMILSDMKWKSVSRGEELERKGIESVICVCALDKLI